MADVVATHFALERAVVDLSTAHRQLTAEVMSEVGTGPEAVTLWSKARSASLTRIRTAIDAIAASGLTVSKTTVAASLLGDLARRRLAKGCREP